MPTPRIVDRLDRETVRAAPRPTSAHGAVMPCDDVGRAADDRERRGLSPTSTVHTVSRSAFGWRSTFCTRATTTPENGGAAGTRSSTSRPDMVKRCARAALSSGGSTSVRSQRSENFMRHELPQEAQIVLEEQAQIVDAVAQHRQAIRSHAEGEALVALRIDADCAQHVRMHLARARDLQPAASPKPMSISAEGSVNGKNDGRKRTSQIVALEEAAQEIGEHAFQVGEAHVLVDPQAFDLVEHRRMRGVAVDAIDAPRRDDLDRRRVRLPCSAPGSERCACADTIPPST